MIASIPTSVKISICTRPLSVARCVRVCATDDDVKTTSVAPETPVAEEVKVSSTSRSLTFDQEVYRTLVPRVSELRGKQLSQGLSNPADIWSFYGPLPELLNGRLAMLGFVACMASEYVSHDTLVQQLGDAPAAILAVFTIIAIASLIPIVRGSSILDDGAGEGTFKLGSFNVTNELINGRAAMLGFAIVAIYEAAAGSPLF